MSMDKINELRNKLLDSKKYKKISIDGSDEANIYLNILYTNYSNEFIYKNASEDTKSFLYENIYSDYKVVNNVDAFRYMEDSCGGLIKLLADKNISYNGINILFCPVFFMEEHDAVSSVGENCTLKKDEFREDMLIDKNLVEMSYLFSINGNEQELPEEVKEYINKVANKKFLIDYNFFAEWTKNNGFPLDDTTYSELIQSQINNKGTVISLEFEKKKTL